jgi:hypothetical protein
MSLPRSIWAVVQFELRRSWTVRDCSSGWDWCCSPW